MERQKGTQATRLDGPATGPTEREELAECPRRPGTARLTTAFRAAGRYFFRPVAGATHRGGRRYFEVRIEFIRAGDGYSRTLKKPAVAPGSDAFVKSNTPLAFVNKRTSDQFNKLVEACS